MLGWAEGSRRETMVVQDTPDLIDWASKPECKE